ncbi:hypothetical protein [Ferrovum myxofaciens]|uniref:Uncharacterized protein n=1 Tax=Ferrovum myxofaciens TaxID=416213 RepID=A0A9E6SXW2_9PROT|nr:hypothetical protein [Ferrovum myxofaciens]QKE37431.1 MAG: hypothetical protein HO273_00690 [Ferrovum myxofaciens]QWY75078.1 MAG: hypothetical protein JVY19_01110 [Ferrovum myxofaciens]QWY77814.1 MAG: hypothetical protein JZL65_01620 [Ferrovum myxofaciens]
MENFGDAYNRMMQTPVSDRSGVLDRSSSRSGSNTPASQPTDYKRWAREIVAAWDADQYTCHYGYHLACEALGIAPVPRKPKFLAHRSSQPPPFADSGSFADQEQFSNDEQFERAEDEQKFSEGPFIHPHYTKDY